MSLPGSPSDPGRVVVAQKPKADIYTVLLIISFVAILLAILCLCLEMSRYKWDIKASGARAAGAMSPPAAAVAWQASRATLAWAPPAGNYL